MERSDNYTPPAVFGRLIAPSEHNPLRSVVQEPQLAINGNVVLRAGREHWKYGPQGVVVIPHEIGGWEQTEHIVLTPDEAREFAQQILDAVNV